MESALYGIFTLVGFVSEIERVSANSCENPVRTRFPWSNLYFLGLKTGFLTLQPPLGLPGI